MHSTAIIALVLAIFTTMIFARPDRRPWSDRHRGKPDNEVSGERPWRTYRLPDHIRLPSVLAGKLEKPTLTFIPKKIMEGKYLLISPALMFKIKETDSEASTTTIPETSTTTVAIEENTTTDVESEEIASTVPSFESRSFSFDDDNDDEDADEEEFSSLDD